MFATDATAKARHDIEICNACRYCEGYCAVFPAMELQRSFTDTDMSYLANLCHNCNGCYHACQFAPPHEYGINLPRVFSDIRLQSYAAYAWPKPLAAAFAHNGLLVGLVSAATIAGLLIAVSVLIAPARLFAVHTGPGAFYGLISWGAMTAVATVTFLFSLLALAMGVRNFWRDTRTALSRPVTVRAVLRALHDVATLRYLGGAGEGCNDADARFSLARRQAHHALFYGFLLCFAATGTATVFDHVLGWIAPYSMLSLPVVLGTLGGIAMLAGCVGLTLIKLRTDPAPVARRVLGADYALLALLFLAAASGLLLLALRDTQAMGGLLALHLGVILSLFLVLPYGKFVHGIYRGAALLKAAIERGANEVEAP